MIDFLTPACICTNCTPHYQGRLLRCRLSITWPEHTLKASSIAWHWHQQRLAVCDGADSVQLFDLTGTAKTASDATTLGSPQPSATLHHSEQKQVLSPSMFLTHPLLGFQARTRQIERGARPPNSPPCSEVKVEVLWDVIVRLWCSNKAEILNTCRSLQCNSGLIIQACLQLRGRVR